MVGNNPDLNRRKVLSAIATAGSGLAIGSGIGSASEAEPELVDDDVDFSVDQSEIFQKRGGRVSSNRIDVPREIYSGWRLFQILSDEEFIDRPSIDALPDSGYEISGHGHTEVGVKMNTNGGDLQITFSEISTPYAVFHKDGMIIEFAMTSDREYSRNVVSRTNDEPGPAMHDNQRHKINDMGMKESSCNPCYGCWCRWAICWCLELVRCRNCYNGTCYTTDKCCC